MRKVHWLFSQRVSLLLGLSVSSALLLDYTSLTPRFCGAESGCGAVRASGLGFVPVPGLGYVPLPLLGVLVFSLFLALSLRAAPRFQARYLAALAYAMGAFGVLFLLVQAFLIHAFCVLCVVVDLASILVCVSAWMLRGLGWDEALAQNGARTSLVDPSEMLPEGSRVGQWQDDSQLYEAPTPLVRPAPREPLRLRSLAWALLATLGLLAPQLFPRFVKAPPIAPGVLELYVDGKINVVEFFDFECPHCRDLAPRLEEVLARKAGKVHFVRRYIPLEQHVRALPASLAALCAGEQGKEEAVAHHLLTDEDLSDAGIERALTGAGVNLELAKACMASDRPKRRLDEDMARFLSSVSTPALPTTFIGGTLLLGALDTVAYVDAVEKAESGDDQSGLPPALYWALVVALAVLIVWFGRVFVPPPVEKPSAGS